MASGQYSTAKGRKNNVLGAEGFAAGYNNSVGGSSSIALGNGNNNLTPTGGRHYTILIGNYNEMRSVNNNAQNNILLGNNNVIPFDDKNIQGAVILGYNNYINSNWLIRPLACGNNLSIDNSAPHYSTVYGNCNTSPGLANAIVVIGAGSDITRRKNAIEINETTCKIRHNLALAADSTEVNAITPPQDPNNVTADDMTLVTKSHLIYQKSQVAYFSEYDTAISVPVDGTGIDVETSLGTIPSWANRLIITFRWENELFVKEIHFTKNEGVHLYAVQRAYSTFPETIVYKHLRLEWDYTNKTLTAMDYWVYDQDMANAGAIANWDHTLANASTCKILSAVYSE